MNAIVNKIVQKMISPKLALAAAAGLGAFALPAGQANAGGRVDVDIRVGDRHEPRYEERETRVWVEPVYRTDCQRVWVQPVYRTVCDRVWVAPVTQTVCDRVWIPDRYEDRRVEHYQHGRCVVVIEHCLVERGHWAEQQRQVVVRDGYYQNVERQELVCDGHWDNVDRQVLVTPGHWEGRGERVATEYRPSIWEEFAMRMQGRY
ncbi:MAG TPA: hypothetical protein VIL86_04150 [Tepidisphaeraceae bacterium]|jgi:hypothetical protein